MLQQMLTSPTVISLSIQRRIMYNASLAGAHVHPCVASICVTHWFARKYGLHAQCVKEALCTGAVAGVDAVQLSGAQWKVPQEVLRQGQTIASFNPAAIEEFIKALHGKS